MNSSIADYKGVCDFHNIDVEPSLRKRYNLDRLLYFDRKRKAKIQID